MKKKVEIGINVLFWIVLFLVTSYLNYLLQSDNISDPDLISRYHQTYFNVLWENVTGFYGNGYLGFMLGFYVFYAWVVPDFVKIKRIGRLLLTIPLGLIVTSIAIMLFSPILSVLLNSDEWNLWAPSFPALFASLFLKALVIALITVLLGALLKASVLWVNSITEKKALQKNQLESENALLLLKAQLNPHFLFNSLNNIDVLMEESVPKASDYLKKLSDILRYVLYDTKEDMTTLSKELEQIENYIALQKIRTSNTQFVQYEVVGHVGEQPIVPMVFLPFVENAFKFSKNKAIEHGVQIRFEVQSDAVRMLCRNRFEAETVVVQKNEGLGIETIRKRLELLYPKRYQLNIESLDGWFTVDLRVPLNHDH